MMALEEKIHELVKTVGTIIRGKDNIIELSMVAILSRGHLLIEDVPGVGKTTLAYALAKSLDLSFKRIQFTADLLPTDIIGVSIYNREKGCFEFKAGPLFSNVILTDEINRSAPKTQSSLLQAMNESRVTVDNETLALPQPFMVLATQNPLEHRGTYPLPESQMDRFMMRLKIGYPERVEEMTLLQGENRMEMASCLEPILSSEEIFACQDRVDRVLVDEVLLEYIMDLVEQSRKSDYLQLGISPRGALHLKKAAQALAFIRGRSYCIPDDLQELAVPVFSHRIIPRVSSGHRGSPAEMVEEIISHLLHQIPVPV